MDIEPLTQANYNWDDIIYINDYNWDDIIYINDFDEDSLEIIKGE